MPDSPYCKLLKLVQVDPVCLIVRTSPRVRFMRHMGKAFLSKLICKASGHFSRDEALTKMVGRSMNDLTRIHLISARDSHCTANVSAKGRSPYNILCIPCQVQLHLLLPDPIPTEPGIVSVLFPASTACVFPSCPLVWTAGLDSATLVSCLPWERKLTAEKGIQWFCSSSVRWAMFTAVLLFWASSRLV